MHPLKRLKFVTLFGILLLVIGIGLFSYSLKVIQEQDEKINTKELALDKLWNYKSSINWLKNVSVTLILPLTSVFISIGGITLTAQGMLPTIQRKKNKINQENP